MKIEKGDISEMILLICSIQTVIGITQHVTIHHICYCYLLLLLFRGVFWGVCCFIWVFKNVYYVVVVVIQLILCNLFKYFSSIPHGLAL